MSLLVAIEGALPATYDVYWSSVAVTHEQQLINTATKRTYPVEELQALVESRSLTALPQPFELSPGQESFPMVMVMIAEGSPWWAVLRVDKNRHPGMLLSRKLQHVQYYLFKNALAFDVYVKEIIRRILTQVFEFRDGNETVMQRVRLGLTLDPAHPYLNALRVYFGDRRSEKLVRLARASTRGARGGNAFDEMLNALKNDGKRYALKYEHGIAEGGGLDVDAAARICANIQTLHPKLKGEVKRDYPFLPDSPPPRLAEMRGASAEFLFAPDVSERSLGERVFRYFELRLLERVLSGDAPDRLAMDPAFEAKVEAVIQPAPDTSLRQKPLETDQLTAVRVQEVPEGAITTITIDVLAVLIGVFRDAKRVELRLFPGPNGRIFLSTVNNGDGGVPRGVAFLGDKKVHLARLCRATIRRDHDQNGREYHYLRELVRLGDPARTTVDAIPSSVVPGAYFKVPTLEVIFAERIVSVGGRRLPVEFQETQAGASRFLAAFREDMYHLELSFASHGGWWTPARDQPPNSLNRAVLTLYRLGGRVHVHQLAETISEVFGTQVRINNTRREVINHEDLMRFVDAEEQIVELTEQGKQHARAFLAIAEGNGVLPSS